MEENKWNAMRKEKIKVEEGRGKRKKKSIYKVHLNMKKFLSSSGWSSKASENNVTMVMMISWEKVIKALAAKKKTREMQTARTYAFNV